MNALITIRAPVIATDQLVSNVWPVDSGHVRRNQYGLTDVIRSHGKWAFPAPERNGELTALSAPRCEGMILENGRRRAAVPVFNSS